MSHHNWKLAACVESLKSIPMETVTEASGSSRSEDGKDGRRKGRVSDKGTACGARKDGGKGGERGGRGSRVEQTGIHAACVFYFAKQGHRRVRNLSFNLVPLHLQPRGGGKKKKHEGLAYFQNNRHVRESIGTETDGATETDGELREAKKR